MRIVREHLRSSMGVMALSLALSSTLFGQAGHVAVCQVASVPAISNNAPLMEKFVAELGDTTALASLKAIRYTIAVSTGTGANLVNAEVTQTRVFPDRLVMITRILGGTESESYLEVSPSDAFVLSEGSKTSLPEAMRIELLNTVRLDRFYVGQNIGSSKVTVTDTGTERIGDVGAAALRLNVEGAEATWYVGRADGRLLRTVTKVPTVDGMVDLVVDYSDWRNCDGLTVSFQRAITQGGMVSHEKVLRVELNPNMTALPPADSVAAASNEQTLYSLGRTAGGGWEIQSQKDAMTDRPSVVYSLHAGGQKGYLAFRCSGDGRFEEAWFDPGIVIDNFTTTPRDLLGGDQSAQIVRVRVDNKITAHYWFVSPDLRALTIGSRDLEEILNTKDYRIEFTIASEGSDVRQFSPSGIYHQLVNRACGF